MRSANMGWRMALFKVAAASNFTGADFGATGLAGAGFAADLAGGFVTGAAGKHIGYTFAQVAPHAAEIGFRGFVWIVVSVRPARSRRWCKLSSG